jgi:hypothetical protein
MMITIGGCAANWALQRLPMLSLCCRPNRPSCPGCLCLCLLARCCTRPGRGGIFAFSPSSVLSVLCSLRLSALSVLFCAISFFHALNCRYRLSALGSHCSFLLVISHSSPIAHRRPLHLAFPGSCTGCSRPHVDYAISIVSAPCRVSESFCVSAPNTHSTSLRV